jgi:hypothetical protein
LGRLDDGKATVRTGESRFLALLGMERKKERKKSKSKSFDAEVAEVTQRSRSSSPEEVGDEAGVSQVVVAGVGQGYGAAGVWP